jgi:hypothetical protein
VYSEVERDGKGSRNKETEAESAAAGRRKEGRCMQKQRGSESNNEGEQSRANMVFFFYDDAAMLCQLTNPFLLLLLDLFLPSLLRARLRRVCAGLPNSP